MSKTTILHFAIVIAVASTIFLTSLGQARLWDRDEPRNAGCAAEMLERGDWVVPIFNDELRHQKPALLYWFMMASYSVFGVSEFAARLPSAIFGIGTALLTYGIARRFFDSSVALLSSIALITCIMFCVASRAATPDAVLIFFSTLGIYIYVSGTISNSSTDGVSLKNDGQWFPQNIANVILMNIAFGLAVLAKGPIGLIVPTAIIGMFLLIQRLEPLPDIDTRSEGRISRLLVSIFRIINPVHFLQTCWYMRPLTAIGVVLLIAAPWYVAVGLKTDGDFTNLFFLNENFARATTVMENHNGSWLFYPATIAIGFFPWSIFLGPILFAVDHQISQRSRHAPAITFLACWVAVQIGLFSLAETKLPSYVTPCYPALAILTSFCLLKWIPQVSTTGLKWRYAAMTTLVVAGIVTTTGLAIAAGNYFPEIWWISCLGLIPIVGGTLAIVFCRQAKTQHFVPVMAATSFLFCLAMFGIGTVAVDSTRETHIVLNEIKSAHKENPVATYYCLESSWVFYAERPIYELQRGKNNAETPSSLNRESFWKKKPVVSPEVFVSENPDAMFITTDEHAVELMQRLPDEFEIQRESNFFLKEDRRLVLIARNDGDSPQTASSSNSEVR